MIDESLLPPSFPEFYEGDTVQIDSGGESSLDGWYGVVRKVFLVGRVWYYELDCGFGINVSVIESSLELFERQWQTLTTTVRTSAVPATIHP